MNISHFIFIIFIIINISLLSNSQIIQNQDFQELSRQDIAQLKKTNFFKRILQESQQFFDTQTQNNSDLGRLISIKEKVTGIISQFKLRFLGEKGVYEIQLSAIQDQNIINFISLVEIGDQKAEQPQISNNI